MDGSSPESIAEAAPARPGRPPRGATFASLKHRNYRLWFTGQLVSLFGTWMQFTAQGFLVYQLTRSPAYLGYVGFANGMPSLLMLYGGVVADRVPRRTLLVITQTFMMALAFILAALTFLGRVQAWHVAVLAAGLGVANAFDAPARQAFVVELVAREDLTNAIALNSTMFNAATALGPALAGVTYALLGPAWCFTINAVTFLAVIAALLMMRFEARGAPTPFRPVGIDLREGVQYTIHHPPVRTLILLVGILSLFGVSVGTLIPAWAVKVLGGDATTNGLLQSARGFGAVASALAIASLGDSVVRGRLLMLGTVVVPLAVLVFAFITSTPLSLLAMAVVGAGMILIMNLANAMVQSHVPDALRGRVMGIYSLVFFGTMPLGALLVGAVGEALGERQAVLLNGGLLLVVALAVWVFAGWLREMK